MKKVFISIFMFLPLMMSAQNVLTPQQQLEQAQKQLEEAQKAVEAAKAAKAEAEEKAKAEAKAIADAKAKAEAQKEAAKAAAEKAAAEKAKIEEQIKAAKAEAARLNAEAEKLKQESEKMSKEAKEAIGSQEVKQIPATELKPAITNEPKTDKVWMVPTVEKKKAEKETKAVNGVVLKDDPKYLTGAVSTNEEGKVEFVMSTDANGKSAQQIYDLVYNYLADLTQNSNNINSRVALVNPSEKIIANAMDEWLVFSSSFISLDRTEFRYQLVAKIADNSLQLTMSRLYYSYEEGRSTGFRDAAENIITDKYALNKKKNGLAKLFGKFRKGTIDRKDQIFNEIETLVKQ